MRTADVYLYQALKFETLLCMYIGLMSAKTIIAFGIRFVL